MPHLTFEYNAAADKAADMAGFAAAMRDAAMATGEFPLAGTRVRGFRADVSAVADGDHAFLHMTVKIGVGRDRATKERVVAALYDAAEAALKPQIGDAPFALSLELVELPPPGMSEKRLNTIRDHLERG